MRADGHGMPDLALRPLAEFSLVDVLRDTMALFADGGNTAPPGFDAAAFDYRYRADHLDRVSSLLAVSGGRTVGLLFAARRGRTTHISALAVAAAARRQGVATALLQRVVDEAAERGDRRVVSEVRADEPGTQELYARLGFTRRRGLCGYVRHTPAPPAPGTAAIVPVDTDVVAGAVATDGLADLPWFFHAATVYGCTTPARGYALENRAFCVVGAKGDQLALRALVVRADSRRRGLARALLAEVAARHAATSIVTQPLFLDGPCDAFFAAAGFEKLPVLHDELVVEF